VADLEEHVRWVAQDAGIPLDERGLEAVLRQGGGSARDTLSALELLAATGGQIDEITPVDEFVEALIEFDAGRALAAVAHTVHRGRDPRTIIDDLVRHLRDCFLTQMAPELVQAQEHRAAELADQARRLGTARIVKVMETLGQALLDMRGAPDQRVVLEVALVRLVHRQLDTGLDALLARVERLEREIVERPPTLAPAPVNPSTGRAVLGGRVSRDASAPTPRPAASSPAPVAASSPSAPEPSPAPASNAGASLDTLVARWSDDVLAKLVGMRRAVAQMVKPVVRDGAVVLMVDNEHAAKRVNDYLDDLSAAVRVAAGSSCPVVVEVRPDAPAEAAPKRKKAVVVPDDDEIDIEEAKKLPTSTAKSTEEELLEAFPAAKFVKKEQ